MVFGVEGVEDIPEFGLQRDDLVGLKPAATMEAGDGIVEGTARPDEVSVGTPGGDQVGDAHGEERVFGAAGAGAGGLLALCPVGEDGDAVGSGGFFDEVRLGPPLAELESQKMRLVEVGGVVVVRSDPERWTHVDAETVEHAGQDGGAGVV